jgi:hypothetical protein
MGMKLDTGFSLERRDRVARHLEAHGEQRARQIVTALKVPKSSLSSLLNHWERQGHFSRRDGNVWSVTKLGLAPPEVVPDVVLPMSKWWHFCDTWQPGDQVVETIDD